MDKRLQLQRAFFRYRADIVQRKFPCQNGPLHTVLVQQFRTGYVMDGHLRAGMHRQAGQRITDQIDKTDILYDHRVHADFIELRQIEQKPHHFLIRDQGIGSHVNLQAVEMRQVYRFTYLLQGKVIRKSAGGKAFSAQINCIGAIGDRGAERFKTTGRG